MNRCTVNDVLWWGPCPDYTPDVIMANDIIQTVCEEYEVTPEELQSPTRRQHTLRPRYVAAYLLYRYTDMSMTCVGEMLGRKTHALVVCANRKAQADGLAREAEAVMDKTKRRGIQPSPEMKRLRELMDEMDVLLDRVMKHLSTECNVSRTKETIG